MNVSVKTFSEKSGWLSLMGDKTIHMQIVHHHPTPNKVYTLLPKCQYAGRAEQ